MRKPIVWVKSVCPICHRDYEHGADYKPKTCSRSACLQEATTQKRLGDNLKRRIQ